MGVAQPLAITMNEGVCLAVEVDAHHIQRRLETGYCDEMASTLDEALNNKIDAAYQSKYQRYSATYVDPMIAPQARATTLKLVPSE